MQHGRTTLDLPAMTITTAHTATYALQEHAEELLIPAMMDSAARLTRVTEQELLTARILLTAAHATLTINATMKEMTILRTNVRNACRQHQRFHGRTRELLRHAMTEIFVLILICAMEAERVQELPIHAMILCPAPLMHAQEHPADAHLQL
jgi:hypothetical protein